MFCIIKSFTGLCGGGQISILSIFRVVFLLLINLLEHTWIYANKVTQDGIPDSFRVALVARKTYHVIRSLRFWVSPISRG